MHSTTISLKRAIENELPSHLANIYLPEISDSKLSDQLLQTICDGYDFNHNYPKRYLVIVSRMWQEVILNTEFTFWQKFYYRLKLLRAKDWVDKRVSHFFHGLKNMVDKELIYIKISQMPEIIENPNLPPLEHKSNAEKFVKIIGILLYLHMQKCKEEVDNVTFEILQRYEIALIEKFKVYSFTF